MKLTRTNAVFSRIAMMLFYVQKIKVLGMTGKFTENILEYIKNTGARINQRGSTQRPQAWGRHPWGAPRGLVGPLDLLRPQLQLYIFVFGEKKNQREGFITFYDMEPPPSPKLSREGWSGVRSGLQRGESVAIIIINLPPSPIS